MLCVYLVFLVIRNNIFVSISLKHYIICMWYVYDLGCKIKHIRRSTVFNIANYENQTAVTLRRVSVSYMGKLINASFSRHDTYISTSDFVLGRYRYVLSLGRPLTHQRDIIVDLVARSASWSDLKFLFISNCIVFQFFILVF